MVTVGLFVKLHAKPGKEAQLENFLKSALPLANAEVGTVVWFALKFGPATFGIFDAFANDSGRQAHLEGAIAAALMANASELLAEAPVLEKVETMAVKLPA
ncbi:MAG: antibiotic biosynthesis monooxygenase [Pseudomonadota bacterium]